MPRLPFLAHRLPDPASDVSGLIERVITDIPAPRTHTAHDPAAEGERIARAAAKKAALVSGSLALPPGPFGLVTVLPDVYLIWKVQRQMVADIFALHGRTAELTRAHMLYCLFRHMASHVLRDFAVRAGQRLVIRRVSSGTLHSVLSSLGIVVAQRIAGTTAGRLIPLAGAAAVGVYAYWDTLQVARTARRLLEAPKPGHPAERAGWVADVAAPDA
jgi:hypothetical protein